MSYAARAEKFAPQVEDTLRHPKTGPSDKQPALLAFPQNDYGNALRIKVRYGDDLAYSHPEKSWFVWDGRRWAKDITGEVIRRAKHTMIEFFSEAAEFGSREAENFAKKSLNQKDLKSALESLQSELPANVSEFDKHRHLLNFKNGTLDLSSLKLGPHVKADKITKLVHYDFVPGAACLLFLKFLNRVVGEQLISYMQKAIGYSLTGETSEKVVFITHGAGNNGKSTLLDIIRQLIPEYSAKILIDSLMVRPGGESTNALADLADLRGARFANTSETEYGQRLSEGRLKRITQGIGEIKAVRKYENPIKFVETHKLWIDANHLPVVNGSESAIWNRLHAIPFSVEIPPNEIDRELPAKLMEEAEGILAWGATGAYKWYGEGLGRPSAISEATDAWRTDMDRIAPFLEEMCEVCPDDPGAWVEQETLRTAYTDWCERRGEKYPLSSQQFNSYLESKRLKRGKADRGSKRVWYGLRFGQRRARGADR